MGNLEDPAAERSLSRVERIRALPDRLEDLLKEIIGRLWPERTGGEPEDRRRVAAIERLDGLSPSGRKLEHQLSVVYIAFHRHGGPTFLPVTPASLVEPRGHPGQTSLASLRGAPSTWAVAGKESVSMGELLTQPRRTIRLPASDI